VKFAKQSVLRAYFEISFRPFEIN